MQTARSKPPDSSTDASAAFQATACTLPPWCVSVWSHAPVVRSHTCNGGVSEALGLRSVLTDESASDHTPPSSGPTPAQRERRVMHRCWGCMSGLSPLWETATLTATSACTHFMDTTSFHRQQPSSRAGVHCMAEAPVLPLQQGGIGKC
jgi:hypothetical protein